MEKEIKKEAGSFARDISGVSELKGGFWSKVGFFTGAGTFVKAGASAAEQGGQSFSRTKTLIQKVFKPQVARPLKTESQDPAERFQVAMKQYGRTEADLEQIAVGSRNTAYSWLFLLVIFSALALFMMPFGSDDHSVWFYIMPWVLHPLLAIKFFQVSHFNWQVRTRRLGSVKEFWNTKSQWIPSAFTIVIATALGMSMFTGQAYAQEIGDMSWWTEADSPSKIFYQVLQALAPFHPIEPGVQVSPWATPFANAAQAFNTLLLTLAVGTLGWHTMAGMVATAHEGVPLGKQWHTIWAPIRVTIGVGFLAPIGTLCAAQYLVLYIALAGSGIGDTVWSAYMETFRDREYMTALIEGREGESTGRANFDAALVEFTTSDDARNMITSIVERQVCFAGLEAIAQSKIDSLKIGRELPNSVTDVASLSEEQFEILHDRLRFVPRFANSFSFDDQGQPYKTTPLELVTLTPNRFTGMSIDGNRLTTSASEIPVGETTMRMVERGGSPIVVLDFGLCGDITMDTWDVKAFQDKIASDPAQYNAAEYLRSVGTQRRAQWTGADRSVERKFVIPDGFVTADLVMSDPAGGFIGGGTVTVHPDYLRAELATHRAAMSAIKNSSERVAARIEAEVLPLTAEAARAALMATKFASRMKAPENDFIDWRVLLYKTDGPVLPLLAEAYQRYEDIIAEERTEMTNSIYAMVDGQQAISQYVDVAQEKGWASAGAMYMIIAHIQKMNYDMDPISLKFRGGISHPEFKLVENLDEEEKNEAGAYARPAVQVFYGEGGVIAVGKSFAQKAYAYIESDASVVAEDFESALNADGNMVIDNLVGDDQDLREAVTDSTSIVNDFVARFDNLKDRGFDYMMSLQPDPNFALLELVDFGHQLMKVGAMILAIGAAGSTIGFWASFANPAAGAVTGTLSGIVTIMGMLLIAMGFVHAYIVVFTPWVLLTFFTIGYMILICEALIAAPLWAFFHIRMDGSDLIENMTRQGYMIVFNILLRPALAILGLILSFPVFSASVWLMNSTLTIAARAAMAEGITIVGLMVVLGLMTYMHYQIAMRSFRLITEIPDRVTRWFGHGSENLGEENDGNRTNAIMLDNIESRAKGVAGQAGQIAGAAATESEEHKINRQHKSQVKARAQRMKASQKKKR